MYYILTPRVLKPWKMFWRQDLLKYIASPNLSQCTACIFKQVTPHPPHELCIIKAMFFRVFRARVLPDMSILFQKRIPHANPHRKVWVTKRGRSHCDLPSLSLCHECCLHSTTDASFCCVLLYSKEYWRICCIRI